MCDELSTNRRLEAITKGMQVADEILGNYMGIEIRKEFDLGTSSGFDRAVGTLAS